MSSPGMGVGEVPRGRWIGAHVTRLEDARVLLAEARYVADIVLPGTVHVSFVRSPHAHARITGVEKEAALAIPGVTGVFTAEDLPTGDVVDAMPGDRVPKTPYPNLARDRVLFVGDAIAAVVGTSPYVAEDGARQVFVNYDVLPAVVDTEAALEAESQVVHDFLGSNLLYRERRSFGDVDAAFAAADHTFSRRTHSNRASASPMETRGCLATFERSTGQLTVWSATQSPTFLRMGLSEVLDHPHHLIRVIAPDVGGGFGPKMPTYPEEVVVAALARKLGRPVRWIEDRRENLLTMNHAKEQVIDLELATRADGRILAMRARCVGDAGAYSFSAATALIEPALAANLMPGVYDFAAYEYEYLIVMTNKTPIGPYRGVGWTAGHTARELLLDEAATELDIDPAALRRMNLIRPEQMPYRSATGCEYDSGDYVETLDLALRQAGYDALRAEQAEKRTGERRIGIGISPYVEPTGVGTEIGVQTGYAFPSHDNASVTVDPGGKVRVAIGISSQGQGHATSYAQVAADMLGVRPEDVNVVAGDTDRTPFGMGAWGSRAAVIGSGAIGVAAQKVRDKVLRRAADMLECSAEDLVLEDSTVSVRGAPGSSITLQDVAVSAYFDTERRTDGDDPFLSATGFYDPRATYSNGCFVVAVEVDMETGLVDVRQVVAVEDCGTVLNPMIVEGQVRGGTVQGIGLALLEHLVHDDQGQLLTTTYMDYLLPLASDAPSIEVHHLESPSPVTRGGVKGMGESALLASPAAVINAVLDAVGPHHPADVVLPLTPERVLRLAGRLPADPPPRDTTQRSMA
jgi:carbon-monoxide dehydrogenase large subunit